MELIDPEGRLFGLINIVDALVILLVLAVGVAGVALVFGGTGGGAPDETRTTHATLDLGTQPATIADALNEGDSYSPSDGSNVTVTDVHLAPETDGTRAVVRVELEGEPGDTDSETDGLSYDGAPPRLGRTLVIQTDRYNASGPIRAVGEDSRLPGNDTRVALRTTSSAETVRELTPGTRLRVGGRTVGTIENVFAVGTSSADQLDLVVVADLSTYRIGDQRFFAGRALTRGASVLLPTAGESVSGSVVRTELDSGFGPESTEVLVTDTLDTDEARALSAGDTYRLAGRDVATVESVSVYGTANPDRKRAYVGLRLETFTFGDDPRFGTTRLRNGAAIPFRTAEYELNGTVVRLGATEQRGSEDNRVVTLEMQDVRPERADSIREGMVERAGGETVARIDGVEREPSPVVLTSDGGDIFLRDHPINRDLTITANLSVRDTTTGVRFKGTTIQPGSNVTLDLGGVTIQAEVLSL